MTKLASFLLFLFAILALFMVSGKTVASAETPELSDEAIAEDVEVVSGGAIGYKSKEEIISEYYGFLNAGKSTFESKLTRSLQASTAHTHTDACYSGHRHTDIYGNSDVILDGEIYFEYEYKMPATITVYCSEDNKPIYKIYWNNSGTNAKYTGQTTLYAYDLNGTATTKVDNFATQGTVESGDAKAIALRSYLNSLITYIGNNVYDTDTTNRRRDSYSTAFASSPISAGLPFWDSIGTYTALPFTGCTYVLGHPDPEACYPIGDLSRKVNVVFETNYSSSYQTWTSLKVYCADCGKLIFSFGDVFGSIGYISNISILKYKYGYDGTIETESYLAGYSSVSKNSSVGGAAADILWEYRLYLLNTYPYTRTVITDTRYIDNFNNITWGMTEIPYIKSYHNTDTFITGTTYWAGCPYHNEFGQYYSCGEEEDSSPDCANVAISITPASPLQTVYVNDAINTSAVVTYMDGHTATVTCATTFVANTVGNNQTATLTYTGLINDAKTTGTLMASVTVSVIPNLSSITVTASATTIYNGTVPTYTVVANYAGGTSKTLSPGQYSYSGWSSGYGQKTVAFSYTENSKTVSASVIITVKPNLSDLTVTAGNTSVLYGTDVSFTCTASYEDGSSKVVTATTVTAFNKNSLGTQNVSYGYTENSITKSGSFSITVLDFPLSISISMEKDWIYQGQDVTIQEATAYMASGSITEITPNVSNYDNLTVGSVNVIFDYALNGINVSATKNVEVRADLYDITLDKDSIVIYKGQDPGINVTASFNISGDIPLSPEEYTIAGFNNNVYDRTGAYYTLSYTSKGITVSKQVFICVMPNITSMVVSALPQTTEGVHIPFSLAVQYEDGVSVTVTEADVGIDDRLNISGYDVDQVGYQDVTFEWYEGGKSLIEPVNIRVRALIKISIPLNMLISIDPNSSDPGGAVSPDIVLENESKEPVIIGIQSITPAGDNGLNDVLPTAHPDWTSLGKEQSKDIAIGFSCEDGWLTSYLGSPLYIAQITGVTGETDVGEIGKESTGTMRLLVKHGNAHSERRDFTYNILWHIRLTE